MRARLAAIVAAGLAAMALSASAGCERRSSAEKGAGRPEAARPAPAAVAGVPRVDGARAFALVESLCAFGPRAPGTPGHDRAKTFLHDRLRAASPDVRVDGFTIAREGGGLVAAANLVARFRPELEDRVVVAAHWDTRPRADRDPDPDRRAEPIVGANDGGSGTALLLLLAEAMASSPPPVGVDLVLFDAEDWGREGDLGQYCLGSRHYASALRGGPLPRAGLVVDMVGDASPAIRRERASLSSAPRLVESIWRIAREVGADAFLDEDGTLVYDDHVPLIQAGIPTVLLIDLDYPFWHTRADLPDKVRPGSLQQVGDVLFAWVYRGAP